MFAERVEAKFRFLESEYGFHKVVRNEHHVQYEKSGSFICLFHDYYNAVGSSVGILNDRHGGFSTSILIDMVTPPVKRFMLPFSGFVYKEKSTIDPDEIERALDEIVEVLKTYGQRVLAADMSVYTEMQHYVDERRRKRGEEQTRLRAEEALAAKDFTEALKQYRLLGDGRKRLDTKRMEMCERQLQLGKPEERS